MKKPHTTGISQSVSCRPHASKPVPHAPVQRVISLLDCRASSRCWIVALRSLATAQASQPTRVCNGAAANKKWQPRGPPSFVRVALALAPSPSSFRSFALDLIRSRSDPSPSHSRYSVLSLSLSLFPRSVTVRSLSPNTKQPRTGAVTAFQRDMNPIRSSERHGPGCSPRRCANRRLRCATCLP